MKRVCRGCGAVQRVDVRQLRIYSRDRQWKFRIALCLTCFGGMFDLIKNASDGFTEGLWAPYETDNRPVGEVLS